MELHRELHSEARGLERYLEYKRGRHFSLGTSSWDFEGVCIREQLVKKRCCEKLARELVALVSKV